MYFNQRAAFWTCTAAGGFLVLVVTGFSLRDLIRPPSSPLKHAANGRNLSRPLKGVLVALILALLRVVLMVVSRAALPHDEISRIILGFVDVWTRFSVLLSLLRVARLFHSSTPAEDSESVPDGLVKPKATASIASNRALDWAVMFIVGIFGLADWALQLGSYLGIRYRNWGWNLSSYLRVWIGIKMTYSCLVIVTILYIIFILLSKWRRTGVMGGGAPGTTDAHARMSFTLKTIPTMVFVGVVLLVGTTYESFVSVWTYNVGYRALYVLQLLVVLIGEPLLLEFSRGALRRLAKLS